MNRPLMEIGLPLLVLSINFMVIYAVATVTKAVTKAEMRKVFMIGVKTMIAGVLILVVDIPVWFWGNQSYAMSISRTGGDVALLGASTVLSVAAYKGKGELRVAAWVVAGIAILLVFLSLFL
jgi:hypothetical protein